MNTDKILMNQFVEEDGAYLSSSALNYLNYTSVLLENIENVDTGLIKQLEDGLCKFLDFPNSPEKFHWLACAGALWDVFTGFCISDDILLKCMTYLEQYAHVAPSAYLFASLTWRIGADFHGRLTHPPLSSELIASYIEVMHRQGGLSPDMLGGMPDRAWVDHWASHGCQQSGKSLSFYIRRNYKYFLNFLKSLDGNSLLKNIYILETLSRLRIARMDVDALITRVYPELDVITKPEEGVDLLRYRCLQPYWEEWRNPFLCAVALGRCGKIRGDAMVIQKMDVIRCSSDQAERDRAAELLMLCGCASWPSEIAEDIAKFMTCHGYARHAYFITGNGSFSGPSPSPLSVEWALHARSAVYSLEFLNTIEQIYQNDFKRFFKIKNINNRSLLDDLIEGYSFQIFEKLILKSNTEYEISNLLNKCEEDLILPFIKNGLIKHISSHNAHLCADWLIKVLDKEGNLGVSGVIKRLRDQGVSLPLSVQSLILRKKSPFLYIFNKMEEVSMSRNIDKISFKEFSLAIKRLRDEKVIALCLMVLLFHPSFPHLRKHYLVSFLERFNGLLFDKIKAALIYVYRNQAIYDKIFPLKFLIKSL